MIRKEEQVLDYSALEQHDWQLMMHVDADNLVSMFNNFVGQNNDDYVDVNVEDVLDEPTIILEACNANEGQIRRENLEAFAKMPESSRSDSDIVEAFDDFLQEMAARGYLPYGILFMENM